MFLLDPKVRVTPCALWRGAGGSEQKRENRGQTSNRKKRNVRREQLTLLMISDREKLNWLVRSGRIFAQPLTHGRRTLGSRSPLLFAASCKAARASSGRNEVTIGCYSSSVLSPNH